MRVLLVEQESLVRSDLASALVNAGFDVTAVANAGDAVAVPSTWADIGVIITDVALFGPVDGVKLSWIVRYKWKAIHIIVVSGRHKAFELELPERCQFFSKPLKIDGLVTAVRALFSFGKEG